MAELKTQKTKANVDEFVRAQPNEAVRQDCLTLIKLIKTATRSDAALWGSNIIGFGSRRITYASGRELDWMLVGFSPRKGKLALYLPGGLEPLAPFLKQLGPHSTGKGCLYFKSLKEVDLKILKQVIRQSITTTT